MIGLPKSTEFNKRIPKQKFYDHIDISPALKKVFVEQVKLVYWKNKIATTTINIAAGKEVTEIEVFELRMNTPVIDENLLRQIDRVIPYHILFILSYNEKYQAWIGYKEGIESSKNSFKVNLYYHTDWLEEVKLPIKLEGLNLDSVYENFIKQIANFRLRDINIDSNIKDLVCWDEKIKQINKKNRYHKKENKK